MYVFTSLYDKIGIHECECQSENWCINNTKKLAPHGSLQGATSYTREYFEREQKEKIFV